MAVNDPTPPTPAPGDPGQPSNPPQNPPPTDPTPAPSDSGSGDASPDKLKSALDSERALRAQHEREARAEKKRADELAAKLAEHEQAKLSETEKATARADAAEKALSDMQGRMRQQAVRHAVASAARDQGFINPDDAPKFLDLDSIDFDDAGEPQGIADRVKALATERPYLLAPKTPPNGPPPTPRSDHANGEMTADEREAVRLRSFSYTRSQI